MNNPTIVFVNVNILSGHGFLECLLLECSPQPMAATKLQFCQVPRPRLDAWRRVQPVFCPPRSSFNSVMGSRVNKYQLAEKHGCRQRRRRRALTAPVKRSPRWWTASASARFPAYCHFVSAIGDRRGRIASVRNATSCGWKVRWFGDDRSGGMGVRILCSLFMYQKNATKIRSFQLASRLPFSP